MNILDKKYIYKLKDRYIHIDNDITWLSDELSETCMFDIINIALTDVDFRVCDEHLHAVLYEQRVYKGKTEECSTSQSLVQCDLVEILCGTGIAICKGTLTYGTNNVIYENEVFKICETLCGFACDDAILVSLLDNERRIRISSPTVCDNFHLYADINYNIES